MKCVLQRLNDVSIPTHIQCSAAAISAAGGTIACVVIAFEKGERVVIASCANDNLWLVTGSSPQHDARTASLAPQRPRRLFLVCQQLLPHAPPSPSGILGPKCARRGPYQWNPNRPATGDCEFACSYDVLRCEQLEMPVKFEVEYIMFKVRSELMAVPNFFLTCGRSSATTLWPLEFAPTTHTHWQTTE
jgi:hypothetical protein